MGINIEHAIEVMEYLKTQNLQLHSLDTAIEIMRKYQRIQKIVKAWNDMNSFDSMKQISEVLEDGSN